MSVLTPEQRASSLEAMKSETFDVLVIGGGVTGALLVETEPVAGADTQRQQAGDSPASEACIDMAFKHICDGIDQREAGDQQ